MNNDDLVLSENDLHKIQDKKTQDEVRFFLEKEKELYGSNDYWKKNKDEIRDSFIDDDFFRIDINGFITIFSSEDFSSSEICIVFDLLANEKNKNTFALNINYKTIMTIYNKSKDYSVKLITKMKKHNIIKKSICNYMVNPSLISHLSVSIDDLNRKIDEFRLL